MGKVAKGPVFDGLGFAVEDQHAGAVALSGGLLGDEIVGQFIIEERKVQT